jgi:SAM-dependent methyltransferase
MRFVNSPSLAGMAESTPEFVVAPDTMVRFRSGRIWVHTRLRPSYQAFDESAVLELLGFFARPGTVEEAKLNLPRMDPRWIEATVQKLKEIPVLIAATRDAAQSEPDRESSLARDHLASLANLTYAVSADLMAFGPCAHQEISGETGVSVTGRIEALLAGMDALAAELADRRKDFVDRQLRRLGVEPGTHGLKLHIGAGPSRLEGWLNIDGYPAELALNLTWGLPFANGTVSHVFISHMLEHLYYPEEAVSALREIRRVLAASGILRLIVPDIEKCIQAYVDRDSEFYASRRKTWTWWGERETRLEGFLEYAGAGPRPGNFEETHKFGYDYETLRKALLKAGFRHIERSEYMQSGEPELRIDNASAVAGSMYRDRYYSLFVEARP